MNTKYKVNKKKRGNKLFSVVIFPQYEIYTFKKLFYDVLQGNKV